MRTVDMNTAMPRTPILQSQGNSRAFPLGLNANVDSAYRKKNPSSISFTPCPIFTAPRLLSYRELLQIATPASFSCRTQQHRLPIQLRFQAAAASPSERPVHAIPALPRICSLSFLPSRSQSGQPWSRAGCHPTFVFPGSWSTHSSSDS